MLDETELPEFLLLDLDIPSIKRTIVYEAKNMPPVAPRKTKLSFPNLFNKPQDAHPS
jgi:hypothetical protein